MFNQACQAWRSPAASWTRHELSEAGKDDIPASPTPATILAVARTLRDQGPFPSALVNYWGPHTMVDTQARRNVTLAPFFLLWDFNAAFFSLYVYRALKINKWKAPLTSPPPPPPPPCHPPPLLPSLLARQVSEVTLLQRRAHFTVGTGTRKSIAHFCLLESVNKSWCL